MKKNIMPTVVLSAICVVVALLLSAVNMITAPIIKAAADKLANETLNVVLPNGAEFEEIDLASAGLPATVTKAFKAGNGAGYVFEVTEAGYQPGLVVMCGVDAEGKITGTKYTASQETYGKEKELDGKYVGQKLDGFDAVMIGGATKTSSGYGKAVKAALQAYTIMSGGSVDLRDPEEILNDNLNAALGTEGKSFTKWFAVEYLEGIDRVYVSDAGVVMQVGENYIGVDAEGKAINGGDNTTAVEAAYEIYKVSALNELELPEGVNKNVLGAWQTDSGNYVIELKAAGYGIQGDYGASGEYIKLKVALTADGKIISVITTYQNESEGIGDVCETPEYTDRYNGITSETIGSVENIAGVTVTTAGYKSAVKLAFSTLELLKGVAE